MRKMPGKKHPLQKKPITMNEVSVKEKDKENKMGVMPVNRLLVTMSLPMIAFLSDAYATDISSRKFVGIFVGRMIF